MPPRSRRKPAHPRYEILDRLGHGGVGAVYLARDRFAGGREVALKVSHLDIAPEQILREFRILRDLRHPGIPRAHDFGRLPGAGATYFTMDHVRGADLEKLGPELMREWKAGRHAALLDVFMQLTEALAYVHRKGLLHLDLKPSNVVLANCVVRLIDFGLFQNVALLGSRRPHGTAHYAAPEVLDGGPVDARADLYSLGVTMYRVFTGRHPFTGRTREELVAKHRDETPPRPAGLPDELAETILRLLQKQPRQRFDRAEEVHAALGRLATGPAARGAGFDEPDFVGRKREFDAFFTWLSKTDDEERRMLLVEGESGIGKSRFLEVCCTELLCQNMQTIAVPSYDTQDDEGLRQLVEKALILSPHREQHRKQFSFLATSLGLASDGAALDELARLDLEQIRSRAFAEATRLISAAVDRTCVVVLEDLHRSGPQLRDFVARFLAAEGGAGHGPPLAIVATARSGMSLTVPERTAQRLTRLRLGPLRREDMLRLASGTRAAMASGTISRLVREAKGNAGVLVQLLRHAHARSRPAEPPPAAPGDLETLFDAVFERVGDDEETLLLHLALIGWPANAAFLRELTGLSAKAFATARGALERLGALVGDENGYSLSSTALRDRCLGRFESRRVRAAHRRVGEQLLRGQTRGAEAAHHLLCGGRTKHGLELAQEVIAGLRASGRIEEALALAQEARSHARTKTVRRVLVETCGDLLEKSGEFEAAGRLQDELLADAALPARTRMRLLRKRGGIFHRSGDSESARRAFEEALDLLETVEDVGEHLHLLNELAALYLFRGEFPRSTSFANRGIELLATTAAKSLRAEVFADHALNLHSVAGHILLRQFEYDRSIEEFQRALSFAEEIGAASNTALILNNLGIAYHQSNRLADALRTYRRASTLARRMGDETALFSIECNVASIKARRGELHASTAILDDLEARPHARGSSRARLFFLHTRGLRERLALTDARTLWDESIRLADTLPDPLFASYGRVSLLENEIHSGRWGAARAVLRELDALPARDAHLVRSIAARRAWLDALCGHSQRAREATAEFLDSGAIGGGARRPAYSLLWDGMLFASALIELGDVDEAASLLGDIKKVFERSRQPPAALECALLQVEIALRMRAQRDVARSLRDCRRALSAVDSGRGARASSFRLPLLEARAALGDVSSGTRRRREVDERLEEASSQLAYRSSAEASWLIELVRAEKGDARAARRAELARERFARSLDEEDRASYARRDHRARLGLVDKSSETAIETTAIERDRQSARRLDALLGLRNARDIAGALEHVLEGLGWRRGAIWIDAQRDFAATRGFGRRHRDALVKLRRSLRDNGSRPRTGGLCVEIRHEGSGRIGVLWAEPERPGEPAGEEAAGYLALAAQTLGALVAERRTTISAASDTTPTMARSTLDTRTLVDGAFFESSSPRMRELLTLVQRTRDSNLPVLLTGESGVGKDHLARWIHGLSPRRERPFIGQDLSAIPEGLLEADLFGHEAGAFTGARGARRGYLLAADGGTFYLDGIDALPLETQAKLLSVLQEPVVRPIGGSTPASIDVRFIASSKRDLKELCARGEFRDDLYFRLAGICLHLPRLRERAEDIPLLVRHFQRQIPGGGPEFTPEALEVLANHDWPGNVRELESVVRRLALTAEGPVDKEEVARVLGLERSPPVFPRWIFETRSYDRLLEDFKREHLLWLFDRFDGNFDRIASELGTTKRNAYLRFSQAGLRPVDLRARDDGGE